MIARELINQAANKLKNKSTSPSLDAEVLLAFVWKKSKEYLAANFTESVPKRIEKQFQSLIAKRAKSWPVAYLVGEKYFYGLKFRVNQNVLIPRPVTEELVEMALEKLKILNYKLKILDIGTGSGCIIISVAKALEKRTAELVSASELNDSEINSGFRYFASDISTKALAIAKQNARFHKAKITFKQGSLLEPWKDQQFNIIIANLPYLPKRTDASTKFEPTQALVAKKQGLALIEKLFKQSREPRLIFLEIGHDQGSAIKKLAAKLLPAYKVQIIRDFTKQTRFAILER